MSKKRIDGRSIACHISSLLPFLPGRLTLQHPKSQQLIVSIPEYAPHINAKMAK
jgi:hypothetical protein